MTTQELTGIYPDPTIDHPAKRIELAQEQCAVCGYIGYIAEQEFCRASNTYYISKELMRYDSDSGEWKCTDHKN